MGTAAKRPAISRTDKTLPSARRSVPPMKQRRRKRTKAQISYNMSRVQSTGSKIELMMERALRGIRLHPKKHARMPGRPDFSFPKARVAVFCDSHFWHGYKWEQKQKEIKSNVDFWLAKIQGNIKRDREVNRRLRQAGWTVLRFWQHQILRSPERCAARVKEAISLRQRDK